MTQLDIDPGYNGITLAQMESDLREGDAPIVALWENTKQEQRVLNMLGDRDVTLMVRSVAMMERTSATLGLPYRMVRDLFETGRASIRGNSTEWRDFTKRMGYGTARGFLVLLASRAVTNGQDYPVTRRVAVDSLLGKFAPLDADVLIALAKQGARP